MARGAIVSDYSRHVAWQAGIRNAPGQTHRTKGDEFHQGNCGGYSESMRCPNGLPIDRRTPGETQWWRDKIERLQRELQVYREADERDLLAVLLTDDEVLQALERIIQWEQSQQLPTPQNSTLS
jgi:hypothetical protein